MLDDFREWLSDNLRYILLGLGVVLIAVIIFCVVRLVTGGRKENSETVNSNTTVQTTAQTEAVTESSDTAEPAAANESTALSGTGELTKNDAALLTLVQQYYTGVAEKNVGTLSQIVDPWDDTVYQDILSADVTEAYQNIAVYSQKGLADGEYVVFAYYDAKLSEIETLVPSLAVLYVKTGEGGKLVVDSARESETDVTAYITQVSNSSDVQALISEVNRAYEAALASDEALSSYVASLEPEEPADEAEQTVSDDSSAAVNTGVQPGTTMSATTTVNIRQTASTGSAIMGVLPEGTEVTVQSAAENGWVQIDYSTSNGVISGYVMLEYLTAAGSAVQQGEEASAAA